MLRIRLSRVGKKKQPSYRLVVADSRSPRDGAHLHIIGHYNPLTDPPTVVVKEEEAVRWLQRGAQPSETAAKLLTRAGVMEKAGKQLVATVTKRAAPPKANGAAAPAPEAAEPVAEAAAPAPEPAEPVAEAAAPSPEAAEPVAEAAAPSPEAAEPVAEAAAPAPEESASEAEPQEQP